MWESKSAPHKKLLRHAFAEDLGRAGDITSKAVIPKHITSEATLCARAGGRIAGLALAEDAFRMRDPKLSITRLCADGDDAPADTPLMRIKGRALSILEAERIALNILSHLSGVATATADLVARIAHTNARVCCTRKTTPGLRMVEKYAVRIGGGVNHRFGLYDGILIKDNHIALAGSVSDALARAQKHASDTMMIEVEVDTLAQLDEALAAGAKAVLLDNMPPDRLREAVARCQDRAITEASGGITPDTIASIAETGVNLISCGWITHSAPALDCALDMETH